MGSFASKTTAPSSSYAKDETEGVDDEAVHDATPTSTAVNGVPADLGYAAHYVDEPYDEIETTKATKKTGISTDDKAVTHARSSATTSTKNGIEETKAKGTTVQVGQVSKVGRSNKTIVGEHEHEREDELKIGMSDGRISAEAATSRSVRDGQKGTKDKSSVGFENDEVKLAREHTDTTYSKDKDGKELSASKTSGGYAAAGAHGVSGGYKVSGSDTAGNKTAVNMGAGFDANNVSANAGLSAESADGSKAGMTASGSIGADGASGSLGWSVTGKNGLGAKGSVHAGTHVDATVAKQGDHFVVTYRKTKSLGVDLGGSVSKVGLSGGASESHYQNGTRIFKTQAEADDFQEHAAERLGTDEIDLTDPTAVLAMPVGETRGAGMTSDVHGGIDGTLEGASAGLSGSKSEGSNVSVTRTGGSIVQASVTSSKGDSTGANVGGYGVAESAKTSEDEYTTITVEFDLATEDGKLFYGNLNRYKAWMGGGKLISIQTHKGLDKDDGTDLMGLGGGHFHGKHWEDHQVDTAGAHDQYHGEASADMTHSNRLAKWLDGGDKKSTVDITALEDNGKMTGYKLAGMTGADKDGGWNMGRMEALTGLNDQDQSHDGAKSSGKWNMTADLPKDKVDAFCDSIVNDHDFDYGAKHALQEALRNAKTNDDKLRAVSAYVGSEGATGLKAMGAQEVPWDVELEGDKNFPGEAGRLAMEQKIAGYQGAIEGKPGAAAGIVGNVQADLDGLRARRAAVADVKMYSDLPNPMRQTELQKIDRLIEQVSSLRHMAAIDACKNDPAADPAHPAAETHEHATPEQKKLAGLRADIGKVDGQILAMQKKIDGNRTAQKGVRMDVGSFGGDGGSYGDFSAQDSGYRNSTSMLTGVKTALDIVIDEMRMNFIASLAKPDEAMAIGDTLLGLIRSQETMMAEAARQSDADFRLVAAHARID